MNISIALRVRGFAAAAMTAVALFAVLDVPDAAVAQEEEDVEAAAEEIEREEPMARVGLTEEFSTALDSAPEAADWELLRQTVALRWEPGKNEELEPGSRRQLVLHAAVIEDGEIREHHTSDATELLPGSTRISPDGEFLPEESMIPDGYAVSNLMALGELEVEPGEIMTGLVRDIVADMTRDAPALYLAATPPEENVDGPHKIHPVLVELSAS